MAVDKRLLPYWEEFRHAIAKRAKPRNESVQLAGGEETTSYLDLKGYFINGMRLRRLGDCMLTYKAMLHYGATAVGGPTMGADFISHAMVNQYEMLEWFSVREPRDHGLRRTIEGTRLDESCHVILVDDVVSSGSSLLRAYGHVAETGARDIIVMPLVDRGGKAAARFDTIGVPYHPLFTHEELGIDPL
jgi:orotate phosphoribosyltransferase